MRSGRKGWGGADGTGHGVCKTRKEGRRAQRRSPEGLMTGKQGMSALLSPVISMMERVNAPAKSSGVRAELRKEEGLK